MDSQAVFTFGQQGLYLLLMVSAPILLTVLVVGLAVSIFQAATQIHEATLSFVPKIVAAVAVLAIAGPWMLTSLGEDIHRARPSIRTVVGGCAAITPALSRKREGDRSLFPLPIAGEG